LSCQKGRLYPASRLPRSPRLRELLRRSRAAAPPLFAVSGRSRSLGAALIPEGAWPLSHSTPPPLSQSCRALAPPAFPLGVGLGSPLSLSVLFVASPLRFCHRRKGPSARASAPEPFTFSSFAEMQLVSEYFTLCFFLNKK